MQYFFSSMSFGLCEFFFCCFSVATSPTPESMLEGEMHRVTVVITNKGTQALDRPRLYATHASFLHVCMANKQHETQSPSAGASASSPTTVHYSRGAVRVCDGADEGAVHLLPIDVQSVQPSQSLELMLWVRPTQQGTHHIRLAFHYRPHDHASHSSG
jgi:hypothetical protein